MIKYNYNIYVDASQCFCFFVTLCKVFLLKIYVALVPKCVLYILLPAVI